MKALYVTGGALTQDLGPADQLRAIASDIIMTVVSTATDALDEVRRAHGYQVLFTAPALPHDDTLALITTLRRDRTPVAVVPVVTGDQGTFSASAMSAGADDVLVMTDDALVGASDTIQRIRQSPHVQPADTRPRLRTLYAGKDPLVWHLLEQIPFIATERAAISGEGTCLLQVPGADIGRLRCDVIVIDEQPGDAHPLQVVKSVKSQAPDLPILVLTSAQDQHTGMAALDLGADEAVSKTGIYRRRLIATLRRLHHRVEIEALHATVVAREARLRQIVERLPEGVAVISDDGRLLAANTAAVGVLGAAQPSDVVGRDFLSLVDEADRDEVTLALEGMREGAERDVPLTLLALDGSRPTIRLRGVLLERDARGGRGVVAMLDRRLRSSASAVPAEDERRMSFALDAEQRAAAVADELQATSAARQDLERELATREISWQDERAALEAQVAALPATLAERDYLAAQLRGVHDERVQAARTLDDLRADWQREREQWEARLASLQDEVTGARTEAARLAADLAAADARRSDETARAERQSLLDVQREVEARQHDDDARAARLERELEAREQALADERDAHADTRGEVSRLRDALARLERTLEERTDEVRHQEDHVADLRARLGKVVSIGPVRAVGPVADLPADSLVALVTTGADGRVSRANDAFAHLLGYADADDLMNAVAGQAVAGLQFARAADADVAPNTVVPVRFPLVTRERQVLDARGTLRRLASDDGEARFERVVLSVSRDAELHNQLRTSSRLGEVGQLSLSMVPELLALVDDWRQQSGSPQADQAEEILGQLAVFGQHQSSATPAMDLRVVIDQARPLVLQLAGPQIRVSFDLASSPVANVSRVDLEQLVTSAVVRGRDLLPAGGALALSTDLSPRGTVVDRGDEDASAEELIRTTLRVTVRGFGLQPPSTSAALEDVVKRCGGRMHTTVDGPRQATFVVALPTPRESVSKEGQS